jgi:hypothetical protein
MAHKKSPIEGVNQRSYNVYVRSASLKISIELKNRGLYKSYYQGGLERTNLFREIHTLPPLTKKKWRNWLVESWISEEDNLLRDCSLGFYNSFAWKQLRLKVLDKYGRICMKCAGNECIAVDHIKPRSLYPHLQLEFDNMQVLCRSCNSKKSNRKIFDLRPKDIIDCISPITGI